MPSRNMGDWFGLNRSPAAIAAALAGSNRNAPPVAIAAVTTKQETAESTGNSINCLSERRMVKLCLTSSQLRENLPIAPSHVVANDGTATGDRLAEGRVDSNSTFEIGRASCRERVD